MATFELSWRAQDTKAGAAGADQLLSDVILQNNIRWFIQLRWIVVAVFLCLQMAETVLPNWLARAGIYLHGPWPMYVAMALVITNLSFGWLRRTPCGHRRIAANTHLWLQIVSDLVCLTVVVHFSGSTNTPAPFFYIVHIALACVFFPLRASLGVALLATVLYVVCLCLEQTGVWPPAGIFKSDEQFTQMVTLWKSAGVILLLLAVWYVVSRLSLTIRQRELQLIQAEEKTRAAQKEKELYAMQMTHQLKSPLDVIRSHITLVKEGYVGDVSPEVMEILQSIDQRAQSLGDLILDVLKLSKLKLFQKEFGKWEKISLDGLLQQTIDELSPIARQRNIALLTSFQHVQVMAVSEQLSMLVHNLITNAIRYSYDNGSVDITCQYRAGVPTVVIADRGIGISAQDLPKLFQEYHRTKEAIKHNKMSTGIGLAIVKKIAEIHNLRIHVESQLAQGTSFTLTFPEQPDIDKSQ